MASIESRGYEGESDGETTENGQSEASSTSERHVTVDLKTRSKVLGKYGHRCQGRGRRGPAAGRVADLQIHHIEQDPDGDYHDPENLTVYLRTILQQPRATEQRCRRDPRGTRMTTHELTMIDGQPTNVTQTVHGNDAGVTRLGRYRQSKPASLGTAQNSTPTVRSGSHPGHSRQLLRDQKRVEPLAWSIQRTVESRA